MSAPCCFRVARSPVAGRGLFATRDIKRGEQIAVGKCEPTSNLQGAYTIFGDDKRAWKMLGPMRFLNHRRPANVRYEDDDVVWATHRIPAGGELFLDYGRGYEP